MDERQLTPLTISVAEAAKITGLSTWYIRDSISKGHIPARRAGRRVLVVYEALIDFLADLDEAA